jgi:hypothetical protein
LQKIKNNSNLGVPVLISATMSHGIYRKNITKKTNKQQKRNIGKNMG